MIDFLDGVVVSDGVLRTLQVLRSELDNSRNLDPIRGLAQWAERAERELRFLVPRAELLRLVLTDRCSRVALIGYEPERSDSARIEIDDAVRRWDLELGELERFRRSWGTTSRIVVPDTNIYLHHPLPFEDIDWHTTIGARAFDELALVVPMVVIDELDRLKDTGKQAVRPRARAALRRLRVLFAPGAARSMRMSNAEHGGVWVAPLLDPVGPYVRRVRPDDELVRRLLNLRSLSALPVVVYTGDVSMTMRAQQAELESILRDEALDEVD